MAGDDRIPLISAVITSGFEACFQNHRHVVLAVSGGPDSMALMHLAAEWKALRGDGAPSFSVITVDHGLRPDSAIEAALVAAAAQGLGFAHTTLHWEGGKPKTGLQAAAREARYRLIGAHLRANGWQAVATGHTQDDQAETVLMRLARGSGVDGLAAMRSVTMPDKFWLLRPLLGVSKARLETTLRDRGVTWIVDPGNEKPEFERGRLRAVRNVLDGLGLQNDQIALSAQRLGRTREALDWTSGYFAEKLGDALHIDDLGFAEIQWDRLLELPEEIRLRILLQLLGSIGGGGRAAVSLGQLEAMTVTRDWQSPEGLTLAGAVFSKGGKGCIMVTREYGRSPLPEVVLAPGQGLEWDNRFTVFTSVNDPDHFTVAALGPKGLDFLAKTGCCNIDGPRRAMVSIPGLWLGDALISAPLFKYFAEGRNPHHFSCQFTAHPYPGFPHHAV